MLIRYTDYDLKDLQQTAKVMRKLNSACEGHFKTDDALVEFMKGMVSQHIGDGPSYCGTYGFMLTTFLDPDDRTVLRVKSSIMPWLVEGYLNSV